jgi:hypothetical protein
MEEYEIQYRAGSLSRYPIHCLNINMEKVTEEKKNKLYQKCTIAL